ncbi:Sua5/YciO/YrdC/YwlC family protein [Tistrella bauzanensis]|uniref:Sua5/YciO/YrdC/YwlC family protein n=1 Tax=Tistrella arctica TaxID=3133430 RepID=A0ABU9YG39_9PROT
MQVALGEPDDEIIDDAEVEHVLDVIRGGGLTLLKANIGYGLIGHTERSIRRMYEVKGRPLTNPCITIGNIEVLRDLVIPLDPRLLDWIAEVSEMTTLAVINRLNPDSRLFNRLTPHVRRQCSENGTVATFIRTGAFVEKLVEKGLAEDLLLVGSSGNISSTGNRYTFADVQPPVLEGVDFWHEKGDAKYRNDQKLATSIVNLTNFTFRRKGVNHEYIEQSLADFRSRTGI